MTLQNLKTNIDREKEILQELSVLHLQLGNINKSPIDEKVADEKKLLINAINSLYTLLKIINNSIPEVTEHVTIFPTLQEKEQEKEIKNLVNLSYNSGGNKFLVTLNKRDTPKFLDELRINKEFVNRLKKSKIIEKKEIMELRSPSQYTRLSNRFFLNLSLNLAKKEMFKNLEKDLRKANLPYMSNSYISTALFSSILVFIATLVYLISVLFFSPTAKIILISVICMFILPIITFFLFIFYPVQESKGIEAKINQEIPFVTLHMSAIASSKIEPSQIFKIIAFGKEYPHTKREMIKIINQTNIYGYDLVTALKNIAKSTPSKKLGELLNGLATTISGGGDLTEFLKKRSETLFFEYKIDREKYTREAETFMDIYISLVVAAPMVMSLLLVLMNIGIMNIGISKELLTFFMVGGIAIINILFIMLLNIRQPPY